MLLVDNNATGFMSLVESSSTLKVTLLDEDKGATQIFNRVGAIWSSNGKYLHEEQVVDFISSLASDCVPYRIDISQRTPNNE